MIIKTEYNSLEEMLLNSSKLNFSSELKNKNLDKDKKDKKCNQDIIGQKFGHLIVIKRVEDSWLKHLKKWRVDVTCDGFRHYYGLFENYEEAVQQRLIGETEWFDKGFEPQRELFEKYRIVRGVSKGRKEIIRQGKQIAKRKEVREKRDKNFLK